MRLLLILLALLLILPIPVAAHSQLHIIKMTQNGFEPQNLTIDENSTVLFLNQDQNDHWPASNSHPTHEIYPEFDPKKAIAPEKSWPFRPKKVGVFKFHDHLDPHLRGTLTVVREKNETKQNFSSSEKTSTKSPPLIEWLIQVKSAVVSNLTQALNKINSLFSPKQASVLGATEFSRQNNPEQIKTLTEMVKTRGTQESWAFFQQTFKGQSGSSGNIHDLAHLLGGLIYNQEGFDGIKVCTPDFAFGCYHGFLDKAFEQSLDGLSQAESACSSLGQDGPFASCVHGIGHGIASFYQTTDLEESLATCQKLKKGQEFCFDGVFMEFERGAPANFYSQDKPYYPCDSLEQEFGPTYSFACGRNQPTVLLSRFNFSFDKLVEVCLNARSSQFQTACTDSLGFLTVRSNSEPRTIVENCNKFGDVELSSRCAKAAAGELIFQDHPGWQQKAPQICQSLALDYQQDCQQHLNQLIKQYNK